MSDDDIEIRGAGLIAVDTSALDAAAVQLDAVAQRFTRTQDALTRAGELYAYAAHESGAAVAATGAACAADEGERARDIAASLREAADLYRYAELAALRETATGTEAARIDAHLGALEERYPILDVTLDSLRRQRGNERTAALVTRTWAATLPAGPWGASGWALAPTFVGAVDTAGRGRVGRDDRLTGPAPPVAVRAIERGPTTAPSSLAGAMSRIPGGQAPVRVEKYTMPDGSRQWAVYVAGTRTFRAGGTEPFDGESNLQLYEGRRSASYQGVADALAAAGVREGEPVHAVGHSQGAMIVSRLAVEGDVDVATLITAGSPVAAEVGDDTTSVALRHLDDPVPALAGPGHDLPVGAPGGFSVERDTHSTLGVDEFFTPHHLAEYVETARQVDASTDPRVDVVRDVWAELGTATSVEATEYAVERTD